MVLTGTVVMQVGLRMVASPLVPFMILLDVSSIVSGVEYPMGTPETMHYFITERLPLFHALSAELKFECFVGRLQTSDFIYDDRYRLDTSMIQFKASSNSNPIINRNKQNARCLEPTTAGNNLWGGDLIPHGVTTCARWLAQAATSQRLIGVANIRRQLCPASAGWSA